MPIRKDTARPTGIVPYAKPPTMTETPTWGQTLGAGMRLESPIVGMYQDLTTPKFPAEPDFKINQALKDSKWGRDYVGELGRATSMAEFRMIEGKIAKEQADKALLAQSGFKGLVSSMAAGLVSPSILLPGMGPARGLKGLGQAAAWAFAGVSFDEALLYAQQETRTEEEAVYGIAAGTVLGGLLGGAMRQLTPDEGMRAAKALEQAERRAVQLPDGETIVIDPPTVRERIVLDPEYIGPRRPVYDDGGTRLTYRATSPEGVETFDLQLPTRSAGQVNLRLDGDTVFVEGDAFSRVDGDTDYSAIQELAKAVKSAVPEGEYIVLPSGEKVLTKVATEVPLGRTAMGTEPYDYQMKSYGPANDPTVPEADWLTRVKEADAAARQVPEFVERQRFREEAAARARDEELVNAQTLSAAERSPRNYAGLAQPESAAGRAAFYRLSRANPVTRLYTQSWSKQARYWISRIQNPGLKMAEGGLNAKEGTILSRVKINQAQLAQFIREYDDSYFRYLYGNEGPEDVLKRQSIIDRVKNGIVGTPDGKMNPRQFGEAVFDTLNKGNWEEVDPAVAKGARSLKKAFDHYKRLHDQFLEEMKDEGRDVAPLIRGDEDLGPGLMNYAHHSYDKNYIIRNSAEFLQDFAEYGEKQYLARFAKSFERFSKRQEALQARLDLAEATPEELSIRLEGAEDELAALELDEDYISGMTRLAEERAELNLAAQNLPAEERTKQVAKQLRQFLKGFREENPTFSDLLRERKSLRQLRNDILRRGGALEEGRAARQEKVLSLHRQANATFETVVEKFRKFQDNKPGMKAEVLTAQRNKLLADMENLLAKVEANFRKAQEAKPDRASVLYDRVAKQGEQVITLHERFKKRALAEHQVWQDDLLLEEAAQFAMRQGREKNYVLALKEKKLLDELEELSPEFLAKAQAADADAIRKQMEQSEDAFDARWREEGGEGVIVTGDASFRQAAKDDADELFRRLTGAPDRAVGMELVGGKKGPQLRRVLQMPYETKRKYLVKDPELVLRMYDRAMSPDLELWRATGSVNGAKMFDEVKEDFKLQREKFAAATHIKEASASRLRKMQALLNKGYNKLLPLPDEAMFIRPGEFLRLKAGEDAKGLVPLTPELREAYSRVLSWEEKQVAQDLQVVVDRLRHDRGYSNNPNGTGYRLGRAALNLQVTVMMGKVVVSSFADVARPWAKYGLMKSIGKGWVPYVSNPKFRKQLKAQDYRLAIGLDPLLHNRAQAYADVLQNAPVYGNGAVALGERALETLANKTGLVALFDYWTAMNKHLASSVAQSVLADNLSVKFGRVKASAQEIASANENLRRMGVDDTLARRFFDSMNEDGGSTDLGGGMWLPNTEEWSDPAAARAYAAVMHNEIDNLIITPGLDLPTVFDENIAYRLFFQFKSFTFATIPRIHMSGLQGNDPYLMQYVLGSLATGALSYYTWAVTSGGDNVEKIMKQGPETWLYEAVDRSGLLGVASLATKVGEQIPGLSDYWIFGGEERTSRRGSDLVGQLAGPTYGTVSKLAQVIAEMDEPTQSTFHKFRTAIGVYNNHFLLDAMLDKLEGWTLDELGIPEKRTSR